MKSTISNTIDGAGAGARVNAYLYPRIETPAFSSDDDSEIIPFATTTTDSGGSWSLSLDRQADIVPYTTYWQIEETIPAVGTQPALKRVSQINVGASDATLLASLITPSTTVLSSYLTQAAADARYQSIFSSMSVAAHFVSAGPTSGSPAAPTFRAIVAGDLPLALTAGTYVQAGGNNVSGPTFGPTFGAIGTLTQYQRFSTDTGAYNVVLDKGRGSGGTPTIVSSGDGLGVLGFRGYDGSVMLNGALIAAFVDGAPGSGSMPGRLTIGTTPSGSNLPTTAITIDSTQTVLLGSAADVGVRRVAASTLGIGLPGSASPATNTLVIGESSRGGTDSNVAGGAAVIRTGAGTGNAASPPLTFQFPAPGSSGTAQESYADYLKLDPANGLAALTTSALSVLELRVQNTKGSGQGDVLLTLDKAATGNSASLHFATGGAIVWQFGTGITAVDDDFKIHDNAAGAIVYIDRASGVNRSLRIVQGSVWHGGTAALATNATAGFLGITSCAGTPTGTPANLPTGQVPLVFDSTNLKLYAYTGGAWKSVTLA